MMQQPMTVAAPEVVAGPVTFTVDLAVKALGGSTVATFLFGLIGYIVFGSTIGADYSTYFGMLLAGTACGGAGAFVIHKQTAGQQCFGIVFTVLLPVLVFAPDSACVHCVSERQPHETHRDATLQSCKHLW